MVGGSGIPGWSAGSSGEKLNEIAADNNDYILGKLITFIGFSKKSGLHLSRRMLKMLYFALNIDTRLLFTVLEFMAILVLLIFKKITTVNFAFCWTSHRTHTHWSYRLVRHNTLPVLKIDEFGIQFWFTNLFIILKYLTKTILKYMFQKNYFISYNSVYAYSTPHRTTRLYYKLLNFLDILVPKLEWRVRLGTQRHIATQLIGRTRNNIFLLKTSAVDQSHRLLV